MEHTLANGRDIMKERKDYRLRYNKLGFFNQVSGISKVGKHTLIKRIEELITIQMEVKNV